MTRRRWTVHPATERLALASFLLVIAPSGVLAQANLGPTNAPLRAAKASPRCQPIKQHGRFTEYAVSSADVANNLAAGVDGNAGFDASSGFNAGPLSRINSNRTRRLPSWPKFHVSFRDAASRARRNEVKRREFVEHVGWTGPASSGRSRVPDS